MISVFNYQIEIQGFIISLALIYVNFMLLYVNNNHLTIWFSISWIGHGITRDIPRSYQVQYCPCG